MKIETKEQFVFQKEIDDGELIASAMSGDKIKELFKSENKRELTDLDEKETVNLQAKRIKIFTFAIANF